MDSFLCYNEVPGKWDEDMRWTEQVHLCMFFHLCLHIEAEAAVSPSSRECTWHLQPDHGASPHSLQLGLWVHQAAFRPRRNKKQLSYTEFTQFLQVCGNNTSPVETVTRTLWWAFWEIRWFWFWPSVRQKQLVILLLSTWGETVWFWGSIRFNSEEKIWDYDTKIIIFQKWKKCCITNI